VDGRGIWDNADGVMANLKKAISLIPKLKGKLVDVDKNYAVVGYASGHNEAQFFQYILDGMYAMQSREKADKAATNTTHQASKVTNEQQEPQTVLALVNNASTDGTDSNDTIVEGHDKGYMGSKDMDWDPFDGVRAPDGWQFFGYMAFYCLGPTTDYFSVLLKMGGNRDSNSNETDTSRAGHRVKKKARNAKERNTGGYERGLNMQTKVNLAAVAQGDDDADMRQLERKFASTTQQISAIQKLLEFKMQMSSFVSSSVEKAKY